VSRAQFAGAVAPAVGVEPPYWPKPPKPPQPPGPPAPLGRPAPVGRVPLNVWVPVGLAVGRLPPPGKPPVGLAHAVVVEPLPAPAPLDELLEQPATTPIVVRPATETAAALSANALRIERPPAFPNPAGVVDVRPPWRSGMRARCEDHVGSISSPGRYMVKL
jgi:hypothetical protein